MNRMELLRMALNAEKNPRDALSLAREMEAFVSGGKPAEIAPSPAPALARVVQANAVIPPPSPPSAAAARAKKQWSAAEKERAARLLDEGLPYKEVGRFLGRSGAAVMKQRVEGVLPVKKHALNPARQLQGAVRAAKFGFTISDRVKSAIFNGAANAQD